MSDAQVEQRFFWTGWFQGQSLFELCLLFALLSLADLLATLKLLKNGVSEGNAAARFVLERFHAPGFIVYKVALVGLLLVVVRIIWRDKPATGRVLLWSANLLMTVIALMHITIMLGMMIGHHLPK